MIMIYKWSRAWILDGKIAEVSISEKDYVLFYYGNQPTKRIKHLKLCRELWKDEL